MGEAGSGNELAGEADDQRRRSHLGLYLLRTGAVLVAYYLGGRLGLAVPFTSGNVSPVWPAAGIALAAILLFGSDVWPGIAIGAFLVNLFSPLPHIAAFGIAIGNTLGPLCSAWLLRRVAHFDSSLYRLRDALSLVTLSLVGTAVTATLGVSVLYATKVHAWSSVGSAWLVWWLGDGMGVLLLTPLVLSVWQSRRKLQASAIFEAAGLIALVVAFMLFLFDRLGTRMVEDVTAFVVFPLVIWAAVRFGMIGAAGVSCLISAIAVWETAHGFGPFVRNSSALHNAAVLHSFLAVISLSGILLASVITERRHAQEALHRHTSRVLQTTAERLQLAQQSANIGSWEWNIQKQTISWSDELVRMHGFNPPSFDGRFQTWLATVHPEDRRSVQEKVIRAASGSEDYDVEYRSIRPDGSTYWTAARGTVLFDHNGAAERMVGICMDITARKLAEEALRRTEKLAATGRLAATIAHEINNPLEAVTNLLFLARQDGSLSSEGREFLSLADEELRRVAHLTRQTLGFYRDDSSPALLDVCKELNQVFDVYGRKLNAKSISVQKHLPEAAEVYGVGGELRQVFSNLVANAIDALSPGGTLIVRVSRGADWKDPRKTGIRVSFADRGCGIRSEQRSKVFEPFFTTKKEIGTGLGLWISHGIIEKYGGSIRMRSSTAPGRSGTVFSIFLPYAARSNAGSTAA